MNYKEKYEKALEWMKSIYPTMQGSDKEDAEHYFPELKESEDERIRKTLVAMVQGWADGESFYSEDEDVVHRLLAWLEKQKERKPAEKQDYSELNDLERAIHRGFLCAGVEDVLVSIVKETAKECIAQMKPTEWTENDEEMIRFYEGHNNEHDYMPLEFKDCLINRLKSIRLQQDRSEEDERIRKELIFFLKEEIPQCSIKEHADKLKEFASYLEKQKGIVYEDEYQRMLSDSYKCGKDEVVSNPEKYGLQKEQKPLTEEEFREMSDELYKKHPWYMQKDQKPINPCDASWDAYYSRGYQRGLEVGRKEQKPAEWTEEDEKMWVDIKGQMIYGSFIPFDKILWLESRLKSLRPQPKQEWSEEDETRLTNILIMLKEYVIHHYSKDDVNKSVDWLENRVKSLRPQPREEIYQSAKHNLAIKFMNYLDENRPESKMSLSNAECEDIDKAFKEDDWEKIIRYANKYAWKPSEYHLSALLAIFNDPDNIGSQTCQLALTDLYEQFKKLM